MDVRHGKCLLAQVSGLPATWASRLLQTMGRVMAMHGARRREGQGEACARRAGAERAPTSGALLRVSGRACARVRNRKPMDRPCLSGFPSVAT